jgi:transketolase
MIKKNLRFESADFITKLSIKDKKIFVCVGDISERAFKKLNKKNFLNIGIMEQTMISFTAGLSKVGFIPFVHTITPFLIERCLEQIKLDFGYQKLSGNLISTGSAFDYSKLGASHHCYSDFKILSSIPKIRLFFPSSQNEIEVLIKKNYKNGLNYFRIPEYGHQCIIKKEKIKTGRPIKIKSGKDLTCIAVGTQLRNALIISEKIKDTYSIEILYIHSINPMQMDLIKKSILKTKKIFLLDEQSEISLVAEKIYKLRMFLNFEFLNINIKNDDFIREYGDKKDLERFIGLEPGLVIKKIKKIFKK